MSASTPASTTFYYYYDSFYFVFHFLVFFFFCKTVYVLYDDDDIGSRDYESALIRCYVCIVLLFFRKSRKKKNADKRTTAADVYSVTRRNARCMIFVPRGQGSFYGPRLAYGLMYDNDDEFFR